VDGVNTLVSKDQVVTLTQWWTNGTLSCFYITGLLPQAGSDTTYYVITYDSSSDTFQPYLLEKGDTIVSGTIYDRVNSLNLMTDDGSPHTVTMNSGNTYYEMVNKSYSVDMISAAVIRTSQVYTFSGFAAENITYNRSTDTWYYNGTALDIKRRTASITCRTTIRPQMTLSRRFTLL
jgi:hypothetical protein